MEDRKRKGKRVRLGAGGLPFKTENGHLVPHRYNLPGKAVNEVKVNAHVEKFGQQS